MTSYYEILGVQPAAGAAEIKAAFRSLAKLYHPDRNPSGKEFFGQVLKAYETLSDPHLRAAYDNRLAGDLPHRESSQKKKEKNWTFTERELKRRQYYNEHIRKYAKATASYNAEAEAKKSYNEFRYILFALPIAVLIFIMIMRLATPESQLRPETLAKPSQTVTAQPAALRQGDSPYNVHFGNDRYFGNSDRAIEVRNHTGRGIIVCFFSDTTFIRSFYMESGYSAEVMQLPPDSLRFRYAGGEEFDYLIKPKGSDVSGAFSRGMKFYESDKLVMGGEGIELTLLPGTTQGFREITAGEFFAKPTDDKEN